MTAISTLGLIVVLVVSFFVGTCLGVVIVSICAISGLADLEYELMIAKEELKRFKESEKREVGTSKKEN